MDKYYANSYNSVYISTQKRSFGMNPRQQQEEKKPTVQKKFLHTFQEHEIERFAKSDDLKMTIQPVSGIPFMVKGFTPIVYEKKIIEVGKGRIFVIKKDGVPVSFTWETTPENLKQAVKEGAISHSALTSQVLCKMGSYRGTVLERIYENGMISNKYSAKEALLTLSQERVELLQPLERLINSNKDLNEVKKILTEYILSASDFRLNLKTQCEPLRKYDASIQQKFKDFVNSDIEKITELRNNLTEDNLSILLRAFGSDSLYTNLNLMMVNTIKQAQGINQNLTYARTRYAPASLFRGEFNSMCEDVMHVIHGYDPDLHNAPSAENQGDFSGMLDTKKGEKHLYQQFSITDKRALAAICKIEGVQSIVQKPKNKFVLKNNNQEIPLTTTRLTQWSALWNTFEKQSSFATETKNAFLRVGIFGLNLVTGIFFTPFDIVLGVVGGLLNFEFSLVEWTKARLPRDIHQTVYSSLTEETKLPNRPVAFYLSHLVGSTVRSVIVDVGNGLFLMGQQAARIPKIVINDLHVGGWLDPKLSSDAIIGNFDKAAKEVRADIKASEEKYSAEFKDQNLKAENEIRRFARPAYHLSPGEWRDIMSVTFRGINAFGNTILHSVHAKDPLIGLVYNFFYFSGLIAVFIPHTTLPLPEFYKQFSDALGSYMAHGTASKGVSTAVTQAQLSAILAELVQRGPNSVLGQVVGKAEENLVDIAVLLVLARTFGDVLRHMPAIGTAIEEEMGSVKSIALVTYGAKIAIILREICEAGEEGEVSEEQIEGFLDRYREATQKYEADLAKEQGEAVAAKTVEEVAAAKEHEEKPKDHSNSNGSFAESTLQGLRMTQTPEEAKKALERLRFLVKLKEHEATLPYLSSIMKRDLQQEANRLFSDTPELLTAIKDKLDPVKPLSIASRTLYIISKYITNSIRCLAAIGTGCTQPFKDLFHDIPKDLTRLLKFVGGAVEFIGLAVYAAFYTVGRAVSDVIFNGILARTEGAIRGTEHSISKATTSAASKISGSYVKMGASLSALPNRAYRAVTHADSRTVLEKHQEQHFKDLFGKPLRQQHAAPDQRTTKHSHGR